MTLGHILLEQGFQQLVLTVAGSVGSALIRALRRRIRAVTRGWPEASSRDRAAS
jgi:hypothetical protein